jgi:hypothetical protein
MSIGIGRIKVINETAILCRAAQGGESQWLDCCIFVKRSGGRAEKAETAAPAPEY